MRAYCLTVLALMPLTTAAFSVEILETDATLDMFGAAVIVAGSIAGLAWTASLFLLRSDATG